MNFNDVVKVELTEYGVDVLNKHYDELYKHTHIKVMFSPKDIRPEVVYTPGKILEFQLWELMHIFGPVMYAGNPKIAFLNNEFTL